MKYHLYEKENCRRVRQTLIRGIYKDKTTKFGDSSPQNRALGVCMKYSKDGKDNVRIGKCVIILEGGS
jgi:hypothetical protein